MTIQQCKYVLKIAECGSFNEAAKKLFIAQSSLSGSIKQLEIELDTVIFERSNHGAFLTEDGAEFVRYASQMIEQNDMILDRFSKTIMQKKLYIATQHYDFIADIFVDFLKNNDYDEYAYSLCEMKTYDIIHEIENAYSDIGIIIVKRSNMDIMERYLLNRGISFTPFLRTQPHIFIRKEHKLSTRDSLNLIDLHEFPYVSYEQGIHNSGIFTEELTESFYTKKHIEITDRASLMNVLMITDCYTIGTGIMPSALNNGAIISIPMDGDERYYIGYIMKTDKKPSELVNKFVRLLNEFGKEFDVKG